MIFDFSEIKNILEEARGKAYKAVNFAMVEAYFNVGKQIVDLQGGNETKEFGKGFTVTNLSYMRQFYLVFRNYHSLSDNLSWTHYRFLLKVENEIHTLEKGVTPFDIIKDPFVLEFVGLKANCGFTESELETNLVSNLQEFLLELGKGFSFVARQKRITAEGDHFYIDLVFYNYILKCFVLIDLKIGKLTHQDIGQMDFYVRYYEDKMKLEGDNPTIGIILSSERNDTVVKYSVLEESKQLFASKYMLYLPTEEELQKEISRERNLIEIEKGFGGEDNG